MAENREGRAGWLSNLPVQSKLILALGLVLSVFVAGTVAALAAQREAIRARDQAAATYEVIVGVDRLIRAVVDQQLTLRGYVITVDDSFLDAHDRGREEFTRLLAGLHEQTHGNALQQTRLDQVSSLMDGYWEAVADPILGWMEHSSSRPQAIAVVTSGQDGRAIEETRRILEEMQATEHEDLRKHNLAVAETTRVARLILLSVLGGGAFLGLLSIAIARNQITNPLVRLSSLMERLAARDHTIEVPGRARRDEVGAIARALEVFKRMAQATDADHWVKSGVAAISARLQEARDHRQFADITLSELLPRIEASVGTFYRYGEGGQLDPISQRGGGEAASRALAGEGPVSLCARQRRPDVQAKHYSGVLPGQFERPDTAVLRPVVLGDALFGVIELGRRGAPEVRHARLLDELMPVLSLSWDNLTYAVKLKQSDEELRRANEALREKSEAAHHQATHDPLTGVPNRLLFMDRLAQAIERARRAGTLFTLCYIDIDGFKPVNDRHGHAAGDALLRAIASRLLEALRRSDTVARLGGDEFVLLMGDPESGGQAFATAERIGRRLAEPYILNVPELPETLVVEVGASIGVAHYPDDARTDDALMKAADAAMYAAKQSGKNRCVRATDLITGRNRAVEK